jgi:hypothetical protein
MYRIVDPLLPKQVDFEDIVIGCGFVLGQDLFVKIDCSEAFRMSDFETKHVSNTVRVTPARITVRYSLGK